MISILIASLGRPCLVDTLKSLGDARIPDGETIEVIIADDSKKGRVPHLVATLDLPFAVTILDVAADNVAVARNACLEASKGDWLLFVDDDEIVEPDWLEAHLSAAREFAADAVFGPVYPLYPPETPAWFVAANPLYQNAMWTQDGRVLHTGRTGNTLVRREAIGTLRFDPDYGRSGGEDSDFFARLDASGRRMVATTRARVHELVPLERTTVRFVLRRAVRSGQIYARLRRKGQGLTSALVFATDALAKIAIAALAGGLLWPFDRARALRLLLRAASNVGKLREIGGLRLMPAWD